MAKKHFLFVVPVDGLEIENLPDREFRIDRVTLISTKWLPYIKRRLGISDTYSVLKRGEWEGKLLYAPVVATMHYTGQAGQHIEDCMNIVAEEVDIFAAAQIGWMKRLYMARMSFGSGGDIEFISSALLGVHHNGTNLTTIRTAGSEVMGFGSSWVRFHRDWGFIYALRDILQGNTKVKPSWRKTLRNVAALAGRSVNTKDRSLAFLLNMIAVEMLLTTQNDKYSQELPKRVDAFLGWSTGLSDAYRSKVADAYKKRCLVVHEGAREEITDDDLEFSDQLVLNILTNIVRHPEVFGSKDDVVDFSRKVEAEAVLGMKPSVRPKTLAHLDTVRVRINKGK